MALGGLPKINSAERTSQPSAVARSADASAPWPKAEAVLPLAMLPSPKADLRPLAAHLFSQRPRPSMLISTEEAAAA